MHEPRREYRTASQAGGITILVAFMMLVLLTIAAVGMSKNSFHEVVTSGTSRQGAMASNVADSGEEWAIYWMDLNNSASSSGAAADLAALKTALLNDETLSGTLYDAMSSSATTPTAYVPGANTAVTLPSMTTTSGSTVTQTVSVGLMRMGKLPVSNTSQGVSSGSYTPATGSETKQAPDLWAVRGDGKVTTGAVEIDQGKEVWLSTPVQ